MWLGVGGDVARCGWRCGCLRSFAHNLTYKRGRTLALCCVRCTAREKMFRKGRVCRLQTRVSWQYDREGQMAGRAGSQGGARTQENGTAKAELTEAFRADCASEPFESISSALKRRSIAMSG
eukprot:2308739-Pleurochrysis_carterae.AAC.1